MSVEGVQRVMIEGVGDSRVVERLLMHLNNGDYIDLHAIACIYRLQ